MATILIADDSPVVLRLISLTLRRAGYEVRLADDGRAALERLAEGGVDLLIADIAMPELDGIELLRQLRADAALGALPVVMLTASDDAGNGARAVAAGANAYLTKPASSGELLEAVGRLLAPRP